MLPVMSRANLVDSDGLRKILEAPWLTEFKLAEMRKRKQIPFVKLGWRTILYDPDKVRAALDRFEVKEVG
jgi:hypothetical protein